MFAVTPDVSPLHALQFPAGTARRRAPRQLCGLPQADDRVMGAHVRRNRGMRRRRPWPGA